MKNTKICLIPLIFIFFSGCSGTDSAFDRVNTTWQGRHVDDFVRTYGPPCASYQMHDGSRAYTFNIQEEKY